MLISCILSILFLFSFLLHFAHHRSVRRKKKNCNIASQEVKSNRTAKKNTHTKQGNTNKKINREENAIEDSKRLQGFVFKMSQKYFSYRYLFSKRKNMQPTTKQEKKNILRSKKGKKQFFLLFVIVCVLFSSFTFLFDLLWLYDDEWFF